ncbi:MAG: glycosyltransferase family A protein [Verrucomicrobiota bacterium]
MSGAPRVSCLMVTLDRLPLLKEAVQCYCDQSYQSRELVIVSDGTEWYRSAVKSYLSFLERDDIRLIEVTERQTLGALRNRAVDEAAGDLLCQWDDDDLYHPDRLTLQVDRLLEQDAGACFMTDQLQFFQHDRTLYWIDWTGKTGLWQYIPGTMMARSDLDVRYPETGDEARRGEDSAFLEKIVACHSVAALSGEGYCYLYRFHGRNVFSHQHHHEIASTSSLSEPSLHQRMKQLQFSLSYYRLPAPYEIRARGPEGACTYGGAP